MKERRKKKKKEVIKDFLPTQNKNSAYYSE